MSASPPFALPSDDELRGRTAAACMNRNVHGLSIAAFHKGREVLLQRDESQNLSLNRPDSYRVPASCMAKILTATIVTEMAYELNISLDAEIKDVLSSKAVPSLASLAGITLRQLLNHSHGLDDPIVAQFPLLSDGRVDLSAWLERMNSVERITTPGATYSYNEVGALLAAAIVEQAGGRRFDRLIRERLLAPLKMTNEPLEDIPGPSLAGYICPSMGDGLSVTATELLNVAKYHLPRAPKSQAGLVDLSVMRQHVIPLPGWNTYAAGSGLGWLDYGGGWFGYNAATAQGHFLLLRFNPEQDSAIAIISQGLAAHFFLNALFGQQLPECVRPQVPRMLNSEEQMSLNYEPLLGRYENGSYVIQIDIGDDRLPAATISNRVAGVGILAAPQRSTLRFAQDNIFFTVPVNRLFLPYGQLISPSTNGDSAYIWNGHRLRRKVSARVRVTH